MLPRPQLLLCAFCKGLRLICGIVHCLSVYWGWLGWSWPSRDWFFGCVTSCRLCEFCGHVVMDFMLHVPNSLFLRCACLSALHACADGDAMSQISLSWCCRSGLTPLHCCGSIALALPHCASTVRAVALSRGMIACQKDCPRACLHCVEGYSFIYELICSS
jgi:hypothetical protein